MILTTSEKFKKATGYDIESLFNNYDFFIKNYYQNIVNYYNGADIDQEAFNYLDFLNGETKKVEPLIDQYGNQFNTTDFWEMNDIFSDIQVKLSTIDSLDRWLRSSRTNRYSENLNVEHIQRQNETLEKISRDVGFNDPDNWSKISLDNQVVEEDYTNIGGRLLNVSLPNSVVSGLDNIVDNLSGDNLRGKDIKKKIEFTADGGLEVLEGKEAIQQTFDTLMSTIQGSIPEFISDGIPSYIYGTNENIIQYPTIFRSLLSMIKKDQRFTSLELLDIKKNQDSIFIELQANTITGNSLTQNIII